MYEWWFAPSNPSGGVMKYLMEPSQRAARGFEGPYSKPLLLTNMTTSISWQAEDMLGPLDGWTAGPKGRRDICAGRRC